MFWCADFFRFPFILVAIIQLFNKLSSEDQQYKMFIKTLKAISSYVHHCVWSLFVPAALILWACLEEAKRIIYTRNWCGQHDFHSVSPSCLCIFVIPPLIRSCKAKCFLHKWIIGAIEAKKQDSIYNGLLTKRNFKYATRAAVWYIAVQ